MKKSVLFFLVLAFSSLQFASAADPQYYSGTNIQINEVTVGYEGSWQWGEDKYHTYPLQMVIERNLMSLQEEFKFDLDNAAERSILLNYLGHLYSISMVRSPAGGTDVVFTVTKDGKPCNQSNGRTIKTLPNNSNADVGDFKQVCGIGFQANWETLALETDVSVEEIYFTGQEVQNNVKQTADYLATNNLNAIVSALESSKSKFRIADISNPNDVVINQVYSHRLYSKPTSLDEESSGKENGLVISNNGEILYVVFINDQFSNDFYVAKPSTSKKVTDYKLWSELKNDAILNWQTVQRDKLSTMQEIEKWLGRGATGVGAAGAATESAYLIGSTGVWAFGAGLNLTVLGTSALATQAGTTMMSIGTTAAAASAHAPGLAGGTFAGTSLTAISITPVGWVLLGTAAVVGGGYTVYNFTVADDYGYDDGSLLLNIDSELFSLRNEAKINFALIRDPDFVPTQTAQLSNGVVAIKFIDLDRLKEKTKNYNGGNGYGIQEILRGSYITDSEGVRLDTIANSKSLDSANDTITFSGFEKGKTYQLWVEFDD
ncbi:MAG: hypothetical protein AABW99_01820, partial [archaeon]